VPIAYRHDRPTGVSVSVWDGVVSSGDRHHHMSLLASDPNWGSGGLLLTDLSTVSVASRPDPHLLLDAASDFLDELAPRARDAKWGVVAGGLFDDARRFGAYIEEDMRRVIVFNEIVTACMWLGADWNAVAGVVADLREELRATGAHTCGEPRVTPRS